MEMPNTIPNTVTQQLLEEKFQIAKKFISKLFFFMGANNDNLKRSKNQCEMCVNKSIYGFFNWEYVS